MRIIAKEGTAFEQTLKQLCEKMTEGIEKAMELVHAYAGVKPKNIFHLYHWGTLSRLVPEFDIHPDDLDKVNPRVLRKKKGAQFIYVPAKRYKEGQEFNELFRNYAKEHEIEDTPLSKFGINTVNFVKGVSYYCQPAHDTETNRYMLICSASIPEAFDKKKLAKEQFEIEY